MASCVTGRVAGAHAWLVSRPRPPPSAATSRRALLRDPRAACQDVTGALPTQHDRDPSTPAERAVPVAHRWEGSAAYPIQLGRENFPYWFKRGAPRSGASRLRAPRGKNQIATLTVAADRRPGLDPGAGSVDSPASQGVGVAPSGHDPNYLARGVGISMRGVRSCLRVTLGRALFGPVGAHELKPTLHTEVLAQSPANLPKQSPRSWECSTDVQAGGSRVLGASSQIKTELS